MAKVPFPCCCGPSCNSRGIWYLTLGGFNNGPATNHSTALRSTDSQGNPASWWYYWADSTLADHLNTIVDHMFLYEVTPPAAVLAVASLSASANLWLAQSFSPTKPAVGSFASHATTFDVRAVVRIYTSGPVRANRRIDVRLYTLASTTGQNAWTALPGADAGAYDIANASLPGCTAMPWARGIADTPNCEDPIDQTEFYDAGSDISTGTANYAHIGLWGLGAIGPPSDLIRFPLSESSFTAFIARDV
jgi:hypothetical protein